MLLSLDKWSTTKSFEEPPLVEILEHEYDDIDLENLNVKKKDEL
jgi:hypothetical protein